MQWEEIKLAKTILQAWLWINNNQTRTYKWLALRITTSSCTIKMGKDRTQSVISTKESSRTRDEQSSCSSKYNKTVKLVPQDNHHRMEHSALIEAQAQVLKVPGITRLVGNLKEILTMEISVWVPVRARTDKWMLPGPQAWSILKSVGLQPLEAHLPTQQGQVATGEEAMATLNLQEALKISEDEMMNKHI